MIFPKELLNIIISYQKELERCTTYERMLDMFATAVTQKPEMRTMSQKEARQSFVRLFPEFRDYFRFIAEDLEQFLGPPVNLGDDIKVWFMLQKDERFPIFPPFEYLTEYYHLSDEEPQEPQPPHTAV